MATNSWKGTTLSLDSGIGDSLKENLPSITNACPEVQFVDPKVKNTWRCIVGDHVLQLPMQTGCGHRMCETCLDDLVRRHPSPTCPAGEEGCVILSERTVIPDFGARKDLSRQLVYCAYNHHGCMEQVEWHLFEEHIEICRYRIWDCPFRHHGCHESGMDDFIKTHVENCRFNNRNCTQCIKNLQSLKLRWENQLRKPIVCNFSQLNCTFVGTWVQFEAHKEEAILYHMEITQVALVRIKQAFNGISHRIEIVEDGLVVLRNQTEDVQKDGDQLEWRTENLMKTMSLTQNEVKASSKKMAVIENETGNFAKKEDMISERRMLSILIESLQSLQMRLSGCEGQTPRTVDRGDTLPSLGNEVQNHGQLITDMSTKLANFDEKLQQLEAARYEGVFIWKITQYSQHKARACSGREPVINSKPFYTCRQGYKLRVKAYINGDGVGKGTHLSIYVTVMKGEFDALLPWPFQQRVTLQVLDQAEKRAHVQDTFRPDPASSSFQRPTAEANPSCGCPMFVAHDLLEPDWSRYVVNDTLFIKVLVGTDNSSYP